MMRQYELIERVLSYKPHANEALLNKAYVYAMQKHGTQTRASGDPYFSHPLEVAAILTDLKLDEETIAVALLHDTIEDTDATRKEIEDLFGAKIGALVEGLTKLKKLDLVSKKAEQAENLRRLLLAVSDDVRVLLVKLADRLHNMRTLDHMRADKQVRIATETMEIYSPLAGRMGMQDLRDELEELSFKFINPDAHQTVSKRLVELHESNKDLVAQITRDLENLLAEQGIQSSVKSRQKRPYSVFRKMQAKELGFEQLSDVYGFRVIVDSIKDCYAALGVVHTNWKMVPLRFKDFISVPKQNDYRSIHTTIVGPSRQRVELQIRTNKMHEIAEYGIAAHNLYKDGLTLDELSSSETNAYATLRRTIEQLASGDNSEEFLEHTKLELFLDQVFCFTPKGKIIALPKGATPIDFAYAVHTDVGNSCIGCKINGKILPMITELHSGDEVEILRSASQTPPAAWENVVVTGKARSAIRRATKEALRKQYSGLGSKILEKVFLSSKKVFKRDELEPVIHRLARSSVEDVLAEVGRGELPPQDVLKAVYPDFKEQRAAHPAKKTDDGWFGMRSGIGMLFRVPGQRRSNRRTSGELENAPIPIRGLKGDLPVTFSRQGGAVPGDRIVGILTPGEGITVYPIQSPQLEAYEDQTERWLDVQWDIEENSTDRFPASLKLDVKNVPGVLALIADVIASNDGNIQNLVMETPLPDLATMQIDVDVWHLRHLNQILNQLSSKPVVSKAERIIG